MVALDSGLVKTVMLKIIGDDSDANRVLDEINARAEELKHEHPELAVKIDRAKAQAEALVAKAEMRKIFGEGVEVPIKLDMPFLPWTAFKRGIEQDILMSIAQAGVFGGGGGGGGGIGGAISGIIGAGGLPGGLVIGALLPGLVAIVGNLVTGLVASALGLGAFGALAYPTISGILSGYSTQKADQAAIQAATTPQAKAQAIAKYKQDLQAVDPAQQKIINQIGQLVTLWQDVSAAFEPFVIKLSGPVLQIAGKLLRDLTPFAQAVVPGIQKLLDGFNKWLSSPGGKQFINDMVKLAAAVTPALAGAIVQVAGAVTHLLDVFAKHPKGVAQTISDIGGVLAWLINGLASFENRWIHNWNQMTTDVRNWYRDVKAVIEAVPNTVRLMINQFMGFWRDIPNQLRRVGRDAIQGFINGMRDVGLGGIASVAGGVVDFFKGKLGIRSPSTVFAEIGRNSWEGFRIGMTQAAGGSALNISRTGGGYGGGQPIIIQVMGTGGLADQVVMEWLKHAIFKRGGGGKNSVQIALGQVH